MLIKNSTLGKPKRKRIYTCTLKSENKENHSRNTKMPGDTKKCFSCQAAASQKPGPALHENAENFNRKSLPGQQVLYPHMLPGGARLCLAGFFHLSLLCLTQGVANPVQPPGWVYAHVGRSKGCSSWASGRRWLILGYFGSHLCSPVEQWDPLACCPWGILPLSAFAGT